MYGSLRRQTCIYRNLTTGGPGDSENQIAGCRFLVTGDGRRTALRRGPGSASWVKIGLRRFDFLRRSGPAKQISVYTGMFNEVNPSTRAFEAFLIAKGVSGSPLFTLFFKQQQ